MSPASTERLDEMLAFDLPGQQRTVSQARRVQDPEAARHVTELAISRLDRQAGEMAACIQALDGNRKLLGLQLPAVHQKQSDLKALQAQAQGQVKTLRENLDGAQADHLKTYRFPTQAHIETLLGQGQLIKGELQALKGEPGTLFELKLQSSALRNESDRKSGVRRTCRAESLAAAAQTRSLFHRRVSLTPSTLSQLPCGLGTTELSSHNSNSYRDAEKNDWMTSAFVNSIRLARQ